ncbi:carbohydrate esterase family 8 protein [Acrodontium crateriforme]|uniref:Pectinesterase n=1 Tax=Acrodontium crateriforme TaxID=150365 RepID=A0AAQ3MAI4_9PEZI|nr:carbohydrate esterase family 8 protein [Acrodontium crateriforme]
MKVLTSFLSVLAFNALASARSRTTPPHGALQVGNGKYQTIQDAINALKSTTEEQSIFIHPGTYNGQVIVPQNLTGPLTIYGYTKDVDTYTANEVTITAAGNVKVDSSDDKTGTLRVESQHFKLYNIDVVNSLGPHGQALALSANAPNQGYYGCSFTGFQDTVLAESGSQLYARCYIEGATDFIFGQDANAWFEKCNIGVLPAGYGTITASGRSSKYSSSYYVINNSFIGAAPGRKVTKGAYYLGRPWGDWARVAVQHTNMTDVINPAGWSAWGTGADAMTDHAAFGEYENYGAGAEGHRASFSSTLKYPVKIEAVLGNDYASQEHIDTSYL